MRSPFGYSRPSNLGPRRAWLVLGGACGGIAVAVALIVLAALVAASAVVIVLETATATLIAIFAARMLAPALMTLRGSPQALDSSELAELRRQLAALPETPHPLGL